MFFFRLIFGGLGSEELTFTKTFYIPQNANRSKMKQTAISKNGENEITLRVEE